MESVHAFIVTPDDNGNNKSEKEFEQMIQLHHHFALKK